MRVPSNLSRAGLGFNMTPMIDVVFQLIIFFLLSSHLAQQEVQLELNLPRAASGQSPDKEEIRRVVINVLPEAPRGYPAGKRIVVGGRFVDAEELAQLIDYEARRAPRASRRGTQGVPGGQLEVRFRCDRKVPYRVVQPLLIACARSGVWKVTFAVVEN
jgi:biopolymer transport protein ExbD